MHEPEAELRVVYELRYRGQSFELPIAGSTPTRARRSCARRSSASTRSATATDDDEQELELVTIRVTATATGVDVELAGGDDDGQSWSARMREATFDGERDRARGAARDSGRRAPRSTARRSSSSPSRPLLIPPGWTSEVDDTGTIRMQQSADRRDARPESAGAGIPSENRPGGVRDPVELRLPGAAAVCEEMGAVLIRSAHSANIKERRDASTALFDPHGEMVMQAEHIPVHLGAMPAAVAACSTRTTRRTAAGSSTTPTAGGTHLPDITVITPVFAGEPS